jgi:hypothetical protein
MTALTIAHNDTDTLTRAGAKALTAEIRAAMRNVIEWAATAVDLIERAWAMRADTALGYESWDAYCRAEFAALRELRIPTDVRPEIVAALAEAGMSTRKIGSALHLADQTVRADLKRAHTPLTLVTAADTPDHAPVVAAAAPALTNVQRALAALAAAGEAGLTSVELHKKVRGLPDSSAILSEAHKRHRIARLSVEEPSGTRGGFAVYVMPEHVGARVVEGPGRRSRRKPS